MDTTHRIGRRSILAGALLAALLAGCPEGSIGPEIVITVDPASVRVVAGRNQNFTATVLNDEHDAGVLWTVTGSGCSGASCGSVSTSTSASGGTVTYFAPDTVPSPASVTITASSLTRSRISATATVTILPAVAVSVSPGVASVNVNAQRPFTATVANDTSNAGVIWTLSGAGCTGAACGTLSATSSASGAPIIYTAPGIVPNPVTVTVTATSVADTTKAATATVTILAAVAVSVSPRVASVNVSAQQSFTATVANDSSNAGVRWILSGAGCAGAACGTLSAASSAGGAPITYTAPSIVPIPVTVIVTATSVADTTKAATATVTILPAIAVNVTPSFASVIVNAQQPFTATVANDLSNAGVNWILSGAGCTGAACGTLSATSSASGAPITYTAPATWPTPADVMLTASSVADHTKSASAAVAITSASSITVSVTPISSTMNVGAQQSLTATVANDTGNAGVRWILSGDGCTGAACGTLSATSSASGSPITYTAPSIVPIPNAVTVTATSVTDSSRSAAGSLYITSGIVVSVTPGPYVGVDLNATQQFSATVINDPGNLGVTWTMSPSCSSCGTISPNGVYTAPAALPVPTIFTIKATSATDYTKSAISTVAITTPGVIRVLVSPPTASICTAGPTCLSHSRRFVGYVFNDPTNSGLTWVHSNGLVGSVSPTTSASGVAVIYAARSNSTGSDHLTATSVADTTKHAQASITLHHP